MTDAFRCEGCGEYYDQAYRFVGLEMDTDAIRHADFIIDDLPTKVYALTGTGEDNGDLCTKCGRRALERLVEEFDLAGGDQA